ncbi:PAS domain S-box protein [Oculatella sp. LEGE 06141]|uniref:response regulator n=1 Tax=Oculatella sp. LEGE 06141 TaxID=1828648 RepID=UPI00188007AB|nr:response regulator [Oculatella sp. LEGE 06141]MBE9180318.1 PAS domain S-box protein [Oculatella sp. LEGE 06141]
MSDSVIKILLIEDNLGDARLLQETLAEADIAHFNLTHVEWLSQGIKRLDQEAFDVVLLDLSLPDSQGLETFRKAQHQVTALPIIVLTGLNDEELAAMALQAGAQDYLVKGQFSGDLLARSIRYAIERKRAEEALRTAATENLLLAQAINSASDGIIITDPNQPDNPIIYLNSAVTRITGYGSEEAIGRNCRFLQGKGTDLHTVASISQAIADRRELKTTLLNYRKDGQPFWNELKISPVFSDDGELLYFIGTQTDVTEVRRAEQKIREQAALLDIATDAILVQDLDNRILYWNKGAERLYGWKSEEAIDRQTGRLIYKQPSPHDAEIWEALLAKGVWQGDLNQVTQSGAEITVESRWTLVRDETGIPHSVLIVSTDITEKKQLEAQFLRAQRLESLGTLAGGIAHDLNNMLSPILMAVQLLELKTTDPQSQQWLNTLETSAKRAAELVKQVLSFARGLGSERVLLHLDRVVPEVEQIVRETFPKSIEIKTSEMAAGIWSVLGDATQLHQVLMNLCVNARDAMPRGGVLQITTENLLVDENYARMNISANVGPYVVITVSDTGTGIDPETLDRVFEPFFTTKEVGKGTGLGLSTVIGIVKDHGGFVTVYSEVGKGTQFKVCLPAIATDEVGQEYEPDLGLPQGQGELILVVDDEVAIREITKTSLEACNYRVMTANDGIEAIALYAEHRQSINATLMDMMMPTMDGATAIRTLQKINPQIKVIAVSGLSLNQQSAISSGNGVKAFLPKPYTAETLLRTLRNVLDEP